MRDFSGQSGIRKGSTKQSQGRIVDERDVCNARSRSLAPIVGALPCNRNTSPLDMVGSSGPSSIPILEQYARNSSPPLLHAVDQVWTIVQCKFGAPNHVQKLGQWLRNHPRSGSDLFGMASKAISDLRRIRRGIRPRPGARVRKARFERGRREIERGNVRQGSQSKCISKGKRKRNQAAKETSPSFDETHASRELEHALRKRCER